MGAPVILADDLCNTRLYPNHVVSAEEEPSSFEAFRASVYRRDQYATATTAASDWWWRCVFDQPRAFDYLALWVHNLKGKAIKFQCTMDATDFSGTLETPLDLTLPSVTTSPVSIDNGTGVLTDDGSWLKRFPVRVAKAIRLFVPNMGAGLKPQVTVRCGLSYSPGGSGGGFDRPSDEEGDQLLVQETVSDTGYRGANKPARVRQGTIEYGLLSAFEYDYVRYHLRGVYGERFPVWLVHDVDQADRAVLAVRPDGALGFPLPPDYPYRRVSLPWIEHEPKVA